MSDQTPALDLPGAHAIGKSTYDIADEIVVGRVNAHAKHGDNSIEAVPGDDLARWLPIIGEEGGEAIDEVLALILASRLGRVSRAGTYDQDRSKLRAELVDVATVAVAWIAAIDRDAPQHVHLAKIDAPHRCIGTSSSHPCNCGLGVDHDEAAHGRMMDGGR